MDSAMTMQDFAAMRSLEHDGKQGWGATTALWVIVAVIIIAAIVMQWGRSCNEKVLFATGLAQLQGRIDCISPKVDELGSQNYGTAQALAGTISALKKSDQYINYNLHELNSRVWFEEREGCGGRGGRGGCGCGGGNRRFDQRSTYEPKSTEVIVSESCVN